MEGNYQLEIMFLRDLCCLYSFEDGIGVYISLQVLGNMSLCDGSLWVTSIIYEFEDMLDLGYPSWHLFVMGTVRCFFYYFFIWLKFTHTVDNLGKGLVEGVLISGGKIIGLIPLHKVYIS